MFQILAQNALKFSLIKTAEAESGNFRSSKGSKVA